MTTFQIFGFQFLLSLIAYSLIAGWYVAPRLAVLPLGAALTPLLFLHAFRHLGMVFLVPTVVGPALPAAFAVPAAYGDLLAAVLALLAILGLRGQRRPARMLVWTFSVVGAVDLLNGLYRGARLGVGLGGAYYIRSFAGPTLPATAA